MRWSILATSAVCLFSLASDASTTYKTKLNWYECTAQASASPMTVADIQTLIRTGNPPFKAIGALHSTNEVVCTNGTVIDMSGFDSFNLNTTALTVTVGGGALLRNVYSGLQSAGYSLIHSTQFGGISIAGGLGTGAHGSTLIHANNLGELTVQLRAVLANGTAATINQESDLRHWRTHLGFLGIVYEVTLKIVPLFKVQASIQQYDESILNNLGTLAASPDMFMAWWYPNVEKVVTYTGKYVNASTTGSGLWNLIPNVTSLVQDLTLVALETQLDWCAFESLTYGDMVGNVVIGTTTALIRPPFLTTSNGLYTSSATGYPGSMVLSTCEPEGNCPWSTLKTMEYAVAVPLERLADAVAIIREIHAQTPFCLPLIGIFFRFAPATDTSMAVEYNQTTVHIELETPILDGVEQSYGRAFLQQLITQVKGRMHWAKNFEDDYTALYSLQEKTAGAQAFMAYASAMDPNGVFHNKFSAMLGV